jgi:hypothetical protein
MYNVFYLTSVGRPRSAPKAAVPERNRSLNSIKASAALLSVKAGELAICFDTLDQLIERVEDPLTRQALRRNASQERRALNEAVGALMCGVDRLNIFKP